MKTPSIPQHPLRNNRGEAVHFDMQQWGDVNSYDFQKAHRHQFHEILVFKNGDAQHDIDFHTYEAQSYAIHFVGAGNVHLLMRGTNSHGYSIKFTTGHFADALIGLLPFSAGNPVLHLTKQQFQEFDSSMGSIWREFESKPPYYEQVVQSLMQTALYQLARIAPPEHETAQKKSRHIASFLDMVKAHHAAHKTVEYYADKLSITPKHLIDLCKKQTGKTPLKHIQDQTISEAKRLLYHTPLSVKEIAYQLGFEEPSYFSKYFRSITGYAPGAYRKSKEG